MSDLDISARLNEYARLAIEEGTSLVLAPEMSDDDYERSGHLLDLAQKFLEVATVLQR